MPRRPPVLTAPQVVIVLWVICLVAGALTFLHAQSAYDLWSVAAAHANASGTGTVTQSEVYSRGDDAIQVQWQDLSGAVHTRWYDVDNANHFPKGAELPITYDPARPELAFVKGVSNPEDDYGAAMVLVVFGILLLPLPWALRFIHWRRAVAGLEATFEIDFLMGESNGRASGVWVLVDDGTEAHYQRVLWEPWLTDVRKQSMRVRGHRVGEGGVVVLDLRGFGRLWPASRARQHAPMLESLRPGLPTAKPYGRLASAALVGAIAGLLPGFFFGWSGGLYCATLVLLLVFFLGGPPLSIRRRNH